MTWDTLQEMIHYHAEAAAHAVACADSAEDRGDTELAESHQRSASKHARFAAELSSLADGFATAFPELRLRSRQVLSNPPPHKHP